MKREELQDLYLSNVPICMITKEERHKRSQERQKLSSTLALWEQRVKDMTHALRLGAPDAAAKLEFCKKERNQAAAKMFELDRGAAKQRIWARGRKFNTTV